MAFFVHQQFHDVIHISPWRRAHDFRCPNTCLMAVPTPPLQMKMNWSAFRDCGMSLSYSFIFRLWQLKYFARKLICKFKNYCNASHSLMLLYNSTIKDTNLLTCIIIISPFICFIILHRIPLVYPRN